MTISVPTIIHTRASLATGMAWPVELASARWRKFLCRNSPDAAPRTHVLAWRRGTGFPAITVSNSDGLYPDTAAAAG
jgi:hypothetical protein